MNPDFSQYVRYEAETGALVWAIKRPCPGGAEGGEVGSVKHDGRYLSFMLNGKRYYAHRVIWELCNGSIPADMCIDDVDGNGINNRIDNLRVASRSLNQRNRRLNKKGRFGLDGLVSHRGGYSVYCAGKYIKWTKDFFDACCIRKSEERRNGYHINNGRAA